MEFVTDTFTEQHWAALEQCALMSSTVTLGGKY